MFPWALERKACGGMAALAFRSCRFLQTRGLTCSAEALWNPPGCNSISPPSSSVIHLQIPRPSPSSGSMEPLMAVPKKKVSPHKKRIRNGPKALKPVPVIVRCTSCGRVKLPHYYCCSGKKEDSSKSVSPN